jgi:hypothetical protein
MDRDYGYFLYSDFDPAVVQTYLALRAEKMIAEVEALKANTPANFLKETA